MKKIFTKHIIIFVSIVTIYASTYNRYSLPTTIAYIISSYTNSGIEIEPCETETDYNYDEYDN